MNELHRAFLAARNYIHNLGFICVALDRACYRGEITERQASNAIALVRERLGSHYTLNNWVCENIPGFREIQEEAQARGDHQTYLNMVQEFRVRWLDALIKEFSK